MALNAVMIEAHMRNPVPLPNENFLYHCNGVSFSLKTGNGYPGNSVAYKSATGTAFVSNQRIVFLSQRTGAGEVESFTAPHTHLQSPKFTQPLFGANRFEAEVEPVAGGGLAQRGLLSLGFAEGGGYDFANKVREMGERIRQIGEVPAYEEELPAYDHPPAYDAPPGYAPARE
ncbi:hypothetical protein EC988_003911 [Linderina pennispora]|nr:hypothetical protein EC988_003911 [Linderina pennispora]